jgi:HAD superfamily hydrolase (TIGR01509 family)
MQGRYRTFPRHQVDAVIFDLDGVLVDSEPLHFRAANRVLCRYGASIDETEYQGYIGLGERPTWVLWRERFGVDAPIEQILEEHTEARLIEIEAGVLPIEPAVHLAQRLCAAGQRLAIASSSAPPVIDALLQALRVAEAFPLRVSGNDPEVQHGKPAPDIYRITARRLNVSAAACLAIEDSQPGVQAAKRAGLTCVAVPTRWTIDHDFTEADLVLQTLRDFPPFR